MAFCSEETWLPPLVCIEQPRTLLAAGHGVRPGFGRNRWFWGLLFTFDFHVTNFEWSLYWTLCPAACSSSHQGAVRRCFWHASMTLQDCHVSLSWILLASGPLLDGSSKCGCTALWCLAQRGAEEPELWTPGTPGRQMLELCLAPGSSRGGACCKPDPYRNLRVLCSRLSAGKDLKLTHFPPSWSYSTHIYWASTMLLIFLSADTY